MGLVIGASGGWEVVGLSPSADIDLAASIQGKRRKFLVLRAAQEGRSFKAGQVWGQKGDKDILTAVMGFVITAGSGRKVDGVGSAADIDSAVPIYSKSGVVLST